MSALALLALSGKKPSVLDRVMEGARVRGLCCVRSKARRAPGREKVKGTAPACLHSTVAVIPCLFVFDAQTDDFSLIIALVRDEVSQRTGKNGSS